MQLFTSSGPDCAGHSDEAWLLVEVSLCPLPGRPKVHRAAQALPCWHAFVEPILCLVVLAVLHLSLLCICTYKIKLICPVHVVRQTARLCCPLCPSYLEPLQWCTRGCVVQNSHKYSTAPDCRLQQLGSGAHCRHWLTMASRRARLMASRVAAPGSRARVKSASAALVAHHLMSVVASPSGVKGILKSPPLRPSRAGGAKRVRFVVGAARRACLKFRQPNLSPHTRVGTEWRRLGHLLRQQLTTTSQGALLFRPGYSLVWRATLTTASLPPPAPDTCAPLPGALHRLRTRHTDNWTGMVMIHPLQGWVVPCCSAMRTRATAPSAWCHLRRCSPRSPLRR